MADKIATRESYGAALVELAEKYDFVVMDADLAEATKTVKFKKAYPARFFDCGIAEGNMMSVAAGIATTGKTVFASTFAMFAAGRAFEQVRGILWYRCSCPGGWPAYAGSGDDLKRVLPYSISPLIHNYKLPMKIKGNYL